MGKSRTNYIIQKKTNLSTSSFAMQFNSQLCLRMFLEACALYGEVNYSAARSKEKILAVSKALLCVTLKGHTLPCIGAGYLRKLRVRRNIALYLT